ncbi:MAG: PEP-CTERM system histidine kinase PrsK [Sphingomonadales bacterium]|nr:PEP-CTERM system histidine kinase PrsK [Sphingomonadales bacterium]NCO49159.1 PEP-CTERM system histidine kinase PrsK [Sphingomonadales bacterium]NCP00075.1 PEP-CTERM system histidine kinase PrsK [Sphingomonadales bacterium]NCP27350.1 PEP-CTERM system histidine kinase PrsK [Sphingomonadales bacterium]NCP42552.1 PEP-CTERM system histidine kinase PrsK [Sphingomonadales bacterium]
MGSLLDYISLFGHGIAAALFGALAIWQFQRKVDRTDKHIWLIIAIALTSFWALSIAVEGYFSPISRSSETLRNFGWLAFMFTLLRAGEGRDEPKTVNVIYAALSFVLIGQMLVDSLLPAFAGSPRLQGVTLYTSLVLRMLFSVGALVLVHNLYSISAPETRWGIRLPMASLAAIWTFDLNLYTITYLTQQTPVELYAMRGPMMATIAPILVLASLRNTEWNLKLSRSVAFRSLSLVAIGSYLLMMLVIATALQIIGGDYARLAQISFLFGTSIGALLLLPSGRFRAWLKVKLAKNFFQHRYDYRSEWIRFTDTIGRPGADSAPFHERVIKAIADITDSPAGLLLVPDECGQLVLQSRWNWSWIEVPALACTARTSAFFEHTSHIVEFDTLRAGQDEKCDATAIPDWMNADTHIWVAVPLVHFDRLAGLMLLARPRVNRKLDWEDLDMLRVVGRQVASYLAEYRSQESLSEVQRFDEFNRRMAFILHDIKNLVSQLSLLAGNAKRHADNPAFQADMIDTLQDSAQKMNGLLERLSQHNKANPEEPKPVKIAELVRSTIEKKRLLHNLESNEIEDLTVMADPARVEQILGHLIQNAIDASAKDKPITIDARRRDLSVAIGVSDQGTGMSNEFIRTQLFKPFSSTKQGGFGIGAYEARALAQAMNGRLEVESTVGAGSRFTLILPLAKHLSEEMSADERAA